MLAIGGFIGIMELVKNTPEDWKMIATCLGVFWSEPAFTTYIPAF